MSADSRYRLEFLQGGYAVCRLPADSEVPEWAREAGTDKGKDAGISSFSSVTRTPDELSIIAAESLVPAGVKSEGGFRLLRVAGSLDFSAVGVLSALVAPLAEAEISVLSVSTFDTDYLLIRSQRTEGAVAALRAAGHTVEDPPAE